MIFDTTPQPCGRRRRTKAGFVPAPAVISSSIKRVRCFVQEQFRKGCRTNPESALHAGWRHHLMECVQHRESLGRGKCLKEDKHSSHDCQNPSSQRYLTLVPAWLHMNSLIPKRWFLVFSVGNLLPVRHVLGNPVCLYSE